MARQAQPVPTWYSVQFDFQIRAVPMQAFTSLICGELPGDRTLLGLALVLGAALLIPDAFGWWIVTAAFDRERLITGAG